MVRVHPAVPAKSICYPHTTIPSGQYSNPIATTRQRASLMGASAVGRPVEIHAYDDRIVTARTDGSSASIAGPSAAARRSTIPWH